MEFFGSRTVWTELNNIVDPDVNDDSAENAADDTGDEHRPSTSQLEQLQKCPNDIEYED